MPLDERQRGWIRDFRDAFEARWRDDARFTSVERHDRTDESTLASRVAVAPHIWLELAIRPFLPQLRAGILTDDRWKSEDLEQAIEDSGDEMSEFIEMGFEEAGLTWREPAVEHYRDQGKYFYFATPLELPDLAALADPAVRDRIGLMFEGYYRAFAPAIRKLSAPT
ncbi:MAG: hypothetical protein AB7Q17_16650 [Phycisphaerae bacterium]